jgi:hypothetical protein
VRPQGHGEVVLLSAFPDAHQAIVRTLRLRGVTVRVPRSGAPLRALGRRPDVILVDLVHGAGLTREMVAALNRRRGQAIVVALHEGSLAAGLDETSDLVVEGFCRYADWPRLLVALAERAYPDTPLLH